MSVEKADLKDVLRRLSKKFQEENDEMLQELATGKVKEEEIPLAGGNWPTDHIPHNNC